MTEEPLRVLFLCTGNSARSQMAEAILKHLTRGAAEVSSAGSDPRAAIHPLAREAVRKLFGLQMEGQRPKSMNAFLDAKLDYVITVCDRAAEVCPAFPGAPEIIRWSFEDPAAVEGGEEERRHAFELTAKDLVGRIRIWLSLPKISARIGQRTVGHAV
jgi:protein-tyrosine-phosphatase